uniref:Glyoxylate reductase/hydroxypyruvate reductase n=1 Tax=Schistocephalus solidus TaxID=70667 RepID=A0A0X3PV74_SCHSO
MLDVFVTMRLPEKTLQRLTDNGLKFDVWTGESSIPPDIFLERVRGVKGIICRLSDRIDSTLLNAAGNQLKVVSTMSVGYDHLDLKALKSRGVRVGYTPEMLTEATAELTVSLLLSVSRRIVEGRSCARSCCVLHL